MDTANTKGRVTLKKSIAQRWFLNSFGVVFLILLAIVLASSAVIHNTYYSSVNQLLKLRSEGVMNVLVRNVESSYFYSETRSYVESFSYKDYGELMAIDLNGDVLFTSSGFSYNPAARMPDYQEAMQSTTGTAIHVGKSTSGEKIMAITRRLDRINSQISAIRLVVSMERVDGLIRNQILMVAVIAVLVLGLVLISGIFFIKSIVRPVRAINSAAKQIASGDFKGRIAKKSDDEIGELCDAINFMADELENTEKMKNEFISSVSHELRTPLTAIKGWAETLIDTDNYDAATMKKGMRVISAETERLSGMVEELLDFSRIQNGRFSLSFQKLDLLAELGEAVLMYTERARREDIEIIYQEPEMLPIVYGDKNRLRQVFINVIDNAIKYSDPGGTVKIDTFVQDEEIIITVADSGCGIAQDDLPKIKTKFYKANYTRRGSGIGLAVADEIMTMHHGKLEIQSTLNVGTTVIVTLPINAEEAAEPSPVLERKSEDEQEL